jgi:hypothetical protein
MPEEFETVICLHLFGNRLHDRAWSFFVVALLALLLRDGVFHEVSLLQYVADVSAGTNTRRHADLGNVEENVVWPGEGPAAHSGQS